MNMENKQVKRNKVFITGIVIIVVSIVFGWPVLPVCAVLAAVYGGSWLKIGGVVYAISWVLLGLGALLAGPGGIRYAKGLLKRIFKKKVEKEG